MENCIRSLLPGGDEVEILIVDDGSQKDNTGEIADRYEREYPGICRAIHQENGGHGAAVNAGLREATGIFFKVVDSDDWVNKQAYEQVLNTLRRFVYGKDTLDMLITNFVYEKQGAKHKKVMNYNTALPKNEVFTWVLDLYATSVDYNPRSAESVAFFKMVQNKLHYAAHGHTAAEVIYERADADKPFMGLTAFSGDFPTAKDIGIAKNYLTEEELRVLNQMVSGYFDFAEVQAIRHRPMYMSDYVEQLDNILRATGEEVLLHAGKISHAQAMEKAKAEYKRYQAQTLSPVEEEYLKTIKQLGKTAKTEAEKQDDTSDPS